MRNRMFKLVTVGIALGACAAASAIWVDIPLEQVIRKADIVVVGKIGKVAAGEGPVKNGRRHDLGTIEVREVVKGDAAMKTVKLAWPSAGGLMTDVDLIYRAGQDGVWILKKDAKADAYWATYPKDFQPVGELKKIKEIVKAQAVTKEEKK